MDPDPDLTILLVGNSAVGKSASGNTILGRTAFESKRSSKPVTTQISEITEMVFGKRISVVDTPGIFGFEREIQTRCQELLQSSTPCLFLVVVKIDQFTIEQKNAAEAAIKVIGDAGFNNCYLLFTRGDDLDDTTLDDFISEDPKSPLRPFVERFEGRHHVFNNKDGGQHQVRELLKKSGHLTNTANSGESQKEMKIVLLGLPGAGKSSSGNTILGSHQFKSAAGFNPVTTETVSKSATVEGRQVKVVDTPGITDKALTPKQLYKEIMKVILEATPGPHAFVVVVRIGRISEADIKLFELLPKLFDSEVCQARRYSMVLFTHGDELEEDQSIDELIQSNRHVSDLVSMCGGRYCVFDNKAKRNREQVRHFLNKIDEMVTANGGKQFTSDLFRMAERFINEERNRSAASSWSDIVAKAWERLWSYIKSLSKFEIFLGILGVILGASVGGVFGGVVGGVVGAVVSGGVIGTAECAIRAKLEKKTI